MLANSNLLVLSAQTIRDLFRLLLDVLHGTETLVYSNHPREAAAYTCLAIIFGWIASGTPSSSANNSVNAALTSVQALVLAVVGPVWH